MPSKENAKKPYQNIAVKEEQREKTGVPEGGK
jgi:hypothetical protein